MKHKKTQYGVWKVEVLNSDPDVAFFHDVIHNNDVTRLQEAAYDQVNIIVIWSCYVLSLKVKFT